MTTVFPSMHRDDMEQIGTAFKHVTCAKCHNLKLETGQPKFCQHEAGLFKIDTKKVTAREDSLLQESMRGYREAGNR